jgi:hypothetical protein
MRDIARPIRYVLVVAAIIVTALAWSGVSFKELADAIYK